MIYHVAKESQWEIQNASTEFVGEGFLKEGFIHCCTRDQLPGVLRRYFNGVTGLILLEVDEAKLRSLLKFEPSTDGEEFPHLYGAINKDAVISSVKI